MAVEPITESAWMFCSNKCRNRIFVQNQHKDYFSGIKYQCPRCDASLDWWDLSLWNLTDEPFIMAYVATLEAKHSGFRIIVPHNQLFRLRLEDYGIPFDASILSVNYTGVMQSSGEGMAALVELDMDTSNPKAFIDRSLLLYPVPIQGLAKGQKHFNVGVTWVAKVESDQGKECLIEALHNYWVASRQRGRYEAAIISANVSVEITLKQLLTTYLETFLSKKKVKTFLDDAATYSHQLNVVLPAILKFTDAPKLQQHILGFLNALRGYRNDLGHGRSLEQPLSKTVAAQCMCSAIFAYHYLHLVKPFLLEEQTKKTKTAKIKKARTTKEGKSKNKK